MAFSNRVQTTTRNYLMPKVADTVLASNVFATRMLARAKKWSGKQMEFPVKVSKNTNGGSFNGFDTFSTTATDNRVKLAYDPKYYHQTSSLPLTEISVNETEDGVIKLLALTLASDTQDMADSVGDLFYGDGSGKDFLGLEAIVDDGTTAATIGGLSRTTYPTLQSTVTSSATLGLDTMRTSLNAAKSGSQKPSLIVCDESVYGYYEQLLQPQERIVKNVGLAKGLKGGTGFTGLDYAGIPVLADEKATSGVMFFLNEDNLFWTANKMKMTEAIQYSPVAITGNDYKGVKGLGFSWSGWIKPANQAAIVGHTYLGGNLMTDNPKRHSKITDIAGV